MADLHVYCDESGTNGRFLIYGGLITTANNADIIDEQIEQWRRTSGLSGEMKWGKASKAMLRRYKAFVDLFFANSARKHIHFAAMIVDRQAIDYRRYRKRDEILGFYVFYYRFIYEKFCKYIHNDSFKMWAYLDAKSDLTPSRLGAMCNVLNRTLRRDDGLTTDAVQWVAAVESHGSNLIQLADVLMGAVHFHANDGDKREGAAPHKVALAKHIAERARVKRLPNRTAPRRVDYEVWPFTFRSGARFALWRKRDAAAQSDTATE